MNDLTAPALLWCDIETSGLDEHRRFPLEIGFRVTDSDLGTLSEASWVVPWHADGVRLHIRPSAGAAVDAMHAESGLWDDCATPGGISVVSQADRGFNEWARDAGIVEWLREAGAAGLPLAGSSVGFDRRWLNWWLEGFEDVPHYRSVDVSSLKIVLGMWCPERVEVGAPVPARRHRVMPDLDDSIAELAFYRRVLGLDVAAVTS